MPLDVWPTNAIFGPTLKDARPNRHALRKFGLRPHRLWRRDDSGSQREFSTQLIWCIERSNTQIRGHESKGKPTGEGVPVDIVTLPDLLFDFGRCTSTTGGRPCSIGGRAALAACSLLHLLSREDHTFRCRLLTKTGNSDIASHNELSKGESLLSSTMTAVT